MSTVIFRTEGKVKNVIEKSHTGIICTSSLIKQSPSLFHTCEEGSEIGGVHANHNKADHPPDGQEEPRGPVLGDAIRRGNRKEGTYRQPEGVGCIHDGCGKLFFVLVTISDRDQ